jgi:hypothetical protein
MTYPTDNHLGAVPGNVGQPVCGVLTERRSSGDAIADETHSHADVRAEPDHADVRAEPDHADERTWST